MSNLTRVGRQQPLSPDGKVPEDPSDVSSIIGSAQRAAIGDLDGDGNNEIVLVDAHELRVVDRSGKLRASMPATAGIEVLLVADLDHDKRAEIVAGWGMDRDHRDAVASVTVIRLAGDHLVEEVVFKPVTTRQEVTSIIADADGSLFIGYFESKYMVHSVIVHRAPASTTDVATIRTATSYARGDLDGDGTPDLIVGRVYGDEIGSDGDAFVLAPDGKRTPLPTTRGVRDMALVDIEGDGQPSLLIADGWHQSYAAQARGLLTRIRYRDGSYHSELVEDTSGQFTVGKILPAHPGGAFSTQIVTSGNRYVRAFRYLAGQWQGVTLAGPARDIAVGDLDGIAGDEILIVAEHSLIISSRDQMWTAP